MKHIVIVGATSAMAEHCARIWAEREDCLFSLITRDQERCTRIQKDLETRNPNTQCKLYQVNFTDPAAISELITRVSEIPVDIALIAHGTLPDQQACEEDLSLCEHTLTINGTSPVIFAEAFAKQMAPLDYGHIALIGSVAGDRGRKSNYVYGAAKGLVTRYAQGLQHRFAKTGVRVTLVKPGPTKTPMTQAMTNADSFADVRDVAQQILKAIDSHTATAYVPMKWALIMMIIRHLPRIVFNRMNI